MRSSYPSSFHLQEAWAPSQRKSSYPSSSLHEPAIIACSRERGLVKLSFGGAAPAAPLRRGSRERRNRRMQNGQNFRHGKHAAAGGRKRASWDDQHAIKLSEIIYDFTASHGHLPDASNKELWQKCCKQFKGRFTPGQLRAKVLRLKARHEQIASGHAKRITLRESTAFDLWTAILLCNVRSPGSPSTGPAATPAPPLSPSAPRPQTGAAPANCCSSLSSAGTTRPNSPLPAGAESRGGSGGAKEQGESSTSKFAGKNKTAHVDDAQQDDRFPCNDFLYRITVADLASTTKGLAGLAEATRTIAETTRAVAEIVAQSYGPLK